MDDDQKHKEAAIPEEGRLGRLWYGDLRTARKPNPRGVNAAFISSQHRSGNWQVVFADSPTLHKWS